MYQSYANVTVIGECRKFTLNMYCHVNMLCYLHRLLTMQTWEDGEICV